MNEIKNLEKTAQRILKAIKDKEKIILYGDSDLDGVTSVIILKETIKSLGGKVDVVYFPNREEEGYGINKKALDYLKNNSPALLIAMDCGIGNFEETKLAKSLGFEVIIIDHHETLGRLPEAEIVVAPKQKGDNYPFKMLSTAGIAFRLSQLILKTSSLKKSFLELVCLSIIADTMPQEGENKILIEEGLSLLEDSWRPGLRVFLKMRPSGENIRQTAQKIVSTLNTAGTENHINRAYTLLTYATEKEAEILVKDLLEKAKEKQLKIKEITSQVEKELLKKIGDSLIFEGESSWPLILLGSVASRICSTYKKPVFIFRKGKEESRGAVRTPQGINGVEVMKNCSELLETYGGHPQAAGFYIKNENLEKFKECLIRVIAKKL